MEAAIAFDAEPGSSGERKKKLRNPNQVEPSKSQQDANSLAKIACVCAPIILQYSRISNIWATQRVRVMEFCAHVLTSSNQACVRGGKGTGFLKA